MAHDNVVSFGQAAVPLRRTQMMEKSRKLVVRCRELMGDTLPRLQQDLFEHLDDDLYELADKSTSDALQTRYFEAMRELRKLRGDIEQCFVTTALSEYDDFWNKYDAGVHGEVAFADETELSLVDNVDLEEDLAVSNIVSKAENRYHRELYALNQRLGCLGGNGDEIKDAENPLGPALLTNSFRQALALWVGDVSIKLVVYKLFDRHVVQFIGGLYDDINDVLITADVLPKVAQRVKRNPVSPSIERSRDPAHDHVDTTDLVTEPGQDSQQELMSMLGELLAAKRGGQGRVLPTHLPVVPTPEVVGALTELQNSVLGVPLTDVGQVHANQAQINATLVQRLGVGGGDDAARRFGQLEQDVIDVISMLFDFILDDRNLPDPMKALLSRLQIPMLKVALLDRSFFASKSHPARRLLNNLARAGMSWSDDGDRSADGLYGHIAALVERVLSDFDDDVDLFAELNEDFSAYLERESRGAQVAEERIAQVNQGQEHLKVARYRVRMELNRRIAATEVVPEAVRALLADGWKDVMLLALLREGEDSEAWTQSLEIADRLLWSVQPKALNEERQKMLRSIPELLRSLRQGFENISIDQYKSAQLFKELQACHIAALRGAAFPSVEQAELDAEAGDEPIAAMAQQVDPAVADNTQQSEAESASDQDLCLRQAQSLAVGQWLQWDDEGQHLRGKLSWKSAVTGCYVFVNRKGNKLKEIAYTDVAEMLRDGRASIVEDPGTPIMDRALDAMLDELQHPAEDGQTT